MHSDKIEIFPFWLLELKCEVIQSDSKEPLLAEVFNSHQKMTASLYSLIYSSQRNIYTNPLPARDYRPGKARWILSPRQAAYYISPGIPALLSGKLAHQSCCVLLFSTCGLPLGQSSHQRNTPFHSNIQNTLPAWGLTLRPQIKR